MIFGILALTLKKKILGIIAIISGVLFSIPWIVIAIITRDEAALGAFIIITITCFPDIIMGIISLVKKENSDLEIDENKNMKPQSLSDKLEELNKLKNEGLITEEDYQKTKNIILENL